MIIKCRLTPERHYLHGFTLLELLAVITIIGIIVGFSLGIKPNGEGYALGNGQRIAASVFQSARAIAVMKQTDTRVIIYRGGSTADRNDASKQLRFMGVVYRSKVDGQWLPANAGVYLPEGIYFIAPSAKSSGVPYYFVTDMDNAMRVSDIKYIPHSSAPDYETHFLVSFPTAQGPHHDAWFFYEFDSRGLSRNPGALFVLAAGDKVEPGSAHVSYSVNFPNAYAVAGFIVRKIGGVVHFTDYEDIEHSYKKH